MNGLYYDLHLHSCLSPCGDEDMTPANIVGMAAVKGLDVIALTDHNSCKNCPAAIYHGQKYGVIVIPGMELCTAEEVHVICLFPELEAALLFDRYVYDRLQAIENDERIFGRQQIMDETDKMCIRDRAARLYNADFLGKSLRRNFFFQFFYNPVASGRRTSGSAAD